jgi:predicted dehydrogenase
MIVHKLTHESQINIGVIGCGGVVEGLHLPVLMSMPGLTVKWVCDSSTDKARRIARDWGIGRAFDRFSDCTDVNAVLVATPVGTRRGILEQTTARGWHALCEKPFALNSGEHREMLKDAERNGLTIGAGYMRRYYWAVEEARKIIRSNALGSLIEIIAGESAQLDRTGLEQSSYRNNSRASGGGVLMETGCHLLDEIMFLSDARRVEIHACDQQVWSDYEVETIASGFITQESGEQVVLQFTVSGVRPIFQGIVFRCESGELRFRLDPAKGLEVFVGQAQQRHLELSHPHPAQQHILAAVSSEWRHFLEAFQTDNAWDSKQETGLLTTDAITQCGEMAIACDSEAKQWQL